VPAGDHRAVELFDDLPARGAGGAGAQVAVYHRGRPRQPPPARLAQAGVVEGHQAAGAHRALAEDYLGKLALRPQRE